MNFRNKNQVMVALALVCVALFGVGVAYWFTVGRHHELCRDGKPPVQQLATGLNQTVYRCHDGQVVTGPILP